MHETTSTNTVVAPRRVVNSNHRVINNQLSVTNKYIAGEIGHSACTKPHPQSRLLPHAGQAPTFIPLTPTWYYPMPHAGPKLFIKRLRDHEQAPYIYTYFQDHAA
jgi:hypothetical protein